MGVSKVEFGNETLIDLTEDTVTPQSLLSGYSAHNKAGELIEGLLQNPEELNKEIETLKRNINDGKKLVANAITEKGVTTATDTSFSTMATNIRKIVTGGNIHMWENIANGTYKFVQQGARWVANNRGVNSSTASSTWKVTLSKATNYRIGWRTATETNYDKLTISVNGVVVVSAVSGIKTSEQYYNATLQAGENSIVATYTKDGSNHNFGDMAYIILLPVTETALVASQYKYQSKSVTPGSSAQTVYPDVGYDGLYSVSISAAQSSSGGNLKSSTANTAPEKITKGVYIYQAINVSRATAPTTLSLLGADKCTVVLNRSKTGTESQRKNIWYIAELNNVPAGTKFTNKSSNNHLYYV